MARIMIADDSRVMAASIRMLCEDLGHEVVGIAADGAEAYLRYSELRPDVVTMDINMPKIDGLTASRNILRKFPDAKIIIISTISNAEGRYNTIDAMGVVDYLVKPIEKEQLQKAILAALGELDERAS